MIISYDYYRIFYFAAKYKSFTQAANVLMSNQPNVTRAIRNLEAVLECTLFVRSNRGVSLTPEGEKLYKRVSVAFEQLQAAEEELSLARSLQKGIVSISATETALHGFLLPLLGQYRKTYPGIRIRIFNHSTPQAISAVKSGLVDFAVVTTPNGAQKPLQEKKLKAFREILVAGPDFKFLQDKVLHLADLPEYPLICLARETKTFEFYSKLFADNGVVLSPDMEAATIDQVLPMIRENLGIGFLPEPYARSAVADGVLHELTLAEEIPQRFICLVKRSDRSLSLAAGTLEKMLRPVELYSRDMV